MTSTFDLARIQNLEKRHGNSWFRSASAFLTAGKVRYYESVGLWDAKQDIAGLLNAFRVILQHPDSYISGRNTIEYRSINPPLSYDDF